MRARGTNWSNWAYDAMADGLQGLASEQEEATAILRECFQGSGPFVLKDPRISTLLPFWEATLARMGWRVSRVLVLRDPAEVAVSQVRRAAVNPDFHRMLRDADGMAALWATTMRTILSTLPDDRTLLVAHSALLARPLDTLEACGAFLGLSPPPGALPGFVTEFLDPSLHRARANGPIQPGWPRLAADVFAALRPEATPRPLPRAEARAVLAAHPALVALMHFLPPVARGLGEASAALADARIIEAKARRDLAAIYAAFGPLADALAKGPATPAVARALEALGPLRQASPDRPALLVLAARLHERAGQAAEAEALWRRVATLLPQAPFPLRALALLLRHGRRDAEAEAVEAELARRLPPSPG
jgi:hypothetical protein